MPVDGYNRIYKQPFKYLERDLNVKGEKQMAHSINDECVACGTCLEECPEEAITEGDIYVIDTAKCTDCASCVEVCPTDAIDA